MTELENKNCFITGAASGIGKALAIALAQEGMNLFITDIDMENLKKTQEEIEKLGVKVFSGKCDVAKYKGFENIAKEFYSKLGNLDLLINNAGIAITDNIAELDLEDWKKVMDVNLWSIIYSIKVFLPKMLERGSGHVVNVSSVAGLIGSSEPLTYITTKFAVNGLSEGLYGRLYDRGIKVSVIVPFYLKTNIYSNAVVKYPEKLINDVGEQKLEEVRKYMMNEFFRKSKSPESVVKIYIEGIKNNDLYILENKNFLSILMSKAKTPKIYENVIRNINENALNVRRKQFLKFGINIDDYA